MTNENKKDADSNVVFVGSKPFMKLGKLALF